MALSQTALCGWASQDGFQEFVYARDRIGSVAENVQLSLTRIISFLKVSVHMIISHLHKINTGSTLLDMAFFIHGFDSPRMATAN